MAKALDKQDSTLVVKASDRDTVLEQISARAARFERFDPDTAAELKSLRQDVKDIFNKGIDPGDDILEELWFLEPKTYDLVEKMSRNYNKVVTPDDFKLIANIMSENLSEEVPILKGFTKFFGRLAADFLTSAKPSQSSLDFAVIARQMVFGNYSSGDKLSPLAAEILGTKASESLSEKLLKRIPWFKPNSTFSDIVFGVKDPIDRVTGKNLGKVKFKLGDIEETLFGGFDVLHPNKLPKNWTNVPVVNFDGKVVEQKFTQSFEEKLLYKDKNGDWVTNIVQVKQKTDPTWWQEIRNKSDTMQDIADLNKAKTAFGVNTNHSNDAVLVKKYHLWGKKNNIDTSTVHDAFLSNAADMLKARDALREIYAESLESNVILHTLNEMRARGLPKDLYDQYLNEAIDTGLIPVPGRSVVGGRVLQIEDILTKEDILRPIEHKFDKNLYWYGIG